MNHQLKLSYPPTWIGFHCGAPITVPLPLSTADFVSGVSEGRPFFALSTPAAQFEGRTNSEEELSNFLVVGTCRASRKSWHSLLDGRKTERPNFIVEYELFFFALLIVVDENELELPLRKNKYHAELN